MSGESEALRPIATRALDYVARGTVVGLGTGRAASAFVEALGERVRDGLDVRGVLRRRQLPRWQRRWGSLCSRSTKLFRSP